MTATTTVKIEIIEICSTIETLDVFADISYSVGDSVATSMIAAPIVKNSDGTIVVDPVVTCGFAFSTVDIAFPVGVTMTTDTEITVEGADLTAQAPTTYTLSYSTTSSQGRTVTATSSVSIEIIEICTTIDALDVFPDISYTICSPAVTSAIAAPSIRNSDGSIVADPVATCAFTF